MSELSQKVGKVIDDLSDLETKLESMKTELATEIQAAKDEKKLYQERSFKLEAKGDELTKRENAVSMIENFVEQSADLEAKKSTFERESIVKKEDLDAREKAIELREKTLEMNAEKLAKDTEALQNREAEYRIKIENEFKDKFASIINK
jgi:chromosome segregation ATPase